MTGFYLLAVVGLLGYLAWRLCGLAVRRIPNPWLAKVCQTVLTFLLMTLLIADEIVGGYQFEKLCQENSAIQVDRATARGKSVYFDPQPDVEIKGTWVRIVMQPRRFVDVTTGETVVSFNDMIAAGGRFIRFLGISEGGMPLTFQGWCQPGDRLSLETLLKNLNITVVRRRETTIGESK